MVFSFVPFITPTETQAGINSWTGNGPEGGEISSFAISPDFSNDQTIFAATYDGGIYKSTNGGDFWNEVSAQSGLYALAISPDYVSDGTLFASGDGIFKSTDGGDSWSQESTMTSISSLAISPEYSENGTRTIFAGSWNDGVYKSIDGGSNWNQVTAGEIEALAIAPNYSENGSRTIFAGEYEDGILKSTDGGSNWSLVSTTPYINSLAVSPAYANDGTVFAGSWGDVLLKSTDGGSNWSQSSMPGINELALSPDYPDEYSSIFVGTYDGVLKSTDDGGNWSPGTGLTSYIEAFAVSPDFANDGIVFAGTDAGVFRSTDGGNSWSSVNTGIIATEVSRLSVSPDYSNDGTIFATTYGSLSRTTDGGNSWSAVTGLTNIWIDALAISPDYANDGTVFTALEETGLFRSVNGGNAWTPVDTGSIGEVRAIAFAPDYANDRTLFAGSWDGIFRSTDGGDSWSQVSSTATDIGSLAVSPDYSNDGIVFAGTDDDGIFKSTDNGNSWIQVSTTTYNRELSFSPNYVNDQTAFAGTNDGVFRSIDGGDSWSPVTGLAVGWTEGLAVSPDYANDRTVFAGAEDGMFRSTDGGNSWSVIAGLASTYVDSLAVSPDYANDRTVFVGTEGRGVLSYSFPETTPPITAIDSNPSSPDGDNGWFKTTPSSITLSPNETATTFYSWDSTSSMTTYTVALSYPSDGTHTLYYYSVDSVKNVETIRSQIFNVDTGLPADPISVTSPSHTTGQWSAENDVSINFSGATDTISGIDGYSVSWSEDGTETPDASIDLQEDATSTSSGAMADGVWYFNLRTRDNAGNWTSTVNSGPYWIDAGAPTNPTGTVELSGTTNNSWQSNNNSPTFVLSGAGDGGGSGVASYYYYFGTSPSGTSNDSTTSTTISPGTVSPGTHYFRVATKDNAGNVSGWKTLFTFKYNIAISPDSAWDSGVGNWSFDASKITNGDFDGDGIDDIAVVYGYETEREVKIFVFKGTAQGGFDAPVIWWSSGAGNWDWEGSKITSGDYNGDGKDDLAMLYGYKAERDVRAFVFLSDSDKFVNSASWFQAGRNNWDWEGSKLVTGDFDGDGKDDLLVLYGYQTERDVIAFVLKSDGNKFKSPKSWFQAGRNNWDWAGSKLSVGDYNGDGKDDLAILYGYQVERDVIAFVFTSDGSKLNSPQNWWQAGAGNWDWAGSKLLSGDYDGDGKDDMAMFYGYGGSQSAIFGFISSGNKFNTTPIWYNSGTGNWAWSATKVLSGDFNGDGADEIVGFYNYGGSHVGVFEFGR